MKTWFVTRHPGAILWAQGAGIKVSNSGIVRDLDPEQIASGDLVVGTLPVNLVEKVIAKGARYLHLSLNLPPEARGKDLSAEEMREYGARLEEYTVAQLAGLSVAEPSQTPRPQVMVCIASGQTQQNVLPYALTGAQKLYVAVSSAPASKDSAANIQRLIEDAILVPDTPSAPLAEVERFAADLYAKIRSETPEAHIILNATGGTKLMSAGFANALGPVGEVVYCDTENDRIEYLQPSSMKPAPLPPDLLELETLLNIQGLKATGIASRDPVWLERARSRQETTRYLLRTGTNNKSNGILALLNSLVNMATSDPAKQNRDRDSYFQPTQYIKTPLYGGGKKVLEQLASAGLFSLEGDTLTFADRDSAVYLRGGWLEEWCALEADALFAHHGLSASHWASGVKVVPLTSSLSEGDSLNELDLVVVWRNRLLVVECKAGKNVEDKSENQTMINKLEAIGHYVGGPFCTRWLASARPIKSELAKERCKKFKVELIDADRLQDFGARLARWMGVAELPRSASGRPVPASGALADAFKKAQEKKQ